MTFTSYKVSKELHEVGFKAETNTLVHPTESILGEKYLAYDLETLIEALPEKICGIYELIINKSGAGYLEEVDGYTEAHARELFCYFDRKRDESITDCVANLLIRLIQQKQI